MMMRVFNYVPLSSDPTKRKSQIFITLFFFVILSLICGLYFVGDPWFPNDYFKPFSPELKPNRPHLRQQYVDTDKAKVSSTIEIVEVLSRGPAIRKCEEKCVPHGSDALPRGIVSKTSNFKMHPLTGPVPEDSKNSRSLLAIAVGIKQKSSVDEIVKKFLADDFVVMLFHYDGAVNEWKDFEWNDKVIHVSAAHQTKWWFAKRFLHPDIVAEYDYIFLWDEDLGVENFNPGRYVSIVHKEGLEISQPGLDASKSDVHHHITVRRNKSVVHRRYYGSKRGKVCDDKSTAPPCVGWVEIMAPVFSKAAWRCTWYMIQNDLIHAWGLDMQLGYCAQGDRTLKVGVVDEEYIVHMGVPTLGGPPNKDTTDRKLSEQFAGSKKSSDSPSDAKPLVDRTAVRQRSYEEWRIFKNRFNTAAKEDPCWVDPYKQSIPKELTQPVDQQSVPKKQTQPIQQSILKKHKRTRRNRHF